VIDAVHHDRGLAAVRTSADQLLAIGLMDRDHGIRDTAGCALKHAEQALCETTYSPAAEPHPEHVGRQVVNVEDQPRAEHLGNQPSDEEEIGWVMDLDDRVAAAYQAQRKIDLRHRRESRVLPQHLHGAYPARVGNRQPTHAHTIDDLE
jgi:hypothetical protein